MHKYTLHKKSTKHPCPNCNKKTMVLYIDVESSEYVSLIVGRCDREINCGYYYTPKSYFMDNNIEYKIHVPYEAKSVKQEQISYHNEKELLATFKYHSENNFISFLLSKFDIQEVEKIVDEYKIGTANFWHFGTIFWQIDEKNLIRGGKIIIYNKSGKRTKYINWVHSLKIKWDEITGFKLSQCFFGEHLINGNENIIAIVESEKTACIMSILFKKYIWLAAGSLNGLNETKMKVLKKRKIILYPDLGVCGPNGSPFSIWKSKCEYFKSKGFDIQISNLLELKGNVEDRNNGFDIADYFLENINYTPKKLDSNEHKLINLLYQKNKNLKLLIDVFDLRDYYGNTISLSLKE
ncbi:DUF6371 domain-containing protein [Flavobacterium yafengii]|uniref:DUF6371 domain-containing protein n=1 Tax=Flavobacterium yafengii TaxID=3041253 RepID=A0AAW6TS76_9FLAO|nr:DUF6371 domain-containing protein [Flavobacterium yafengii]MDI5951271.1 DUF6371 domain-containing protein [Flavobacterium yafengii]